MSEDDTDRPGFRNEETRLRRAWIDRAVASARDWLATEARLDDPAGGQPAADTGSPAPKLYLVRPGRR